MRTSLTTLFVAIGMSVGVGWAQETLSPLDAYLANGRLARGEAELAAALQKTPDDDNTRFALGAVRAIRAIEGPGQGIHGLGVRGQVARQIPFLRLPVPENLNPPKVKPEDVRAVLVAFRDALAKAEATLEPIRDESVVLDIRLGQTRLDLDADGTPDDPLRAILARYMPDLEGRLRDNADLRIRFDRADVAWLRGYCHLLMGLCDVVLAHDMTELFHHAAHVVFSAVDSPYPFLAQSGRGVFAIDDGIDIADLIAAIHLMRFPVREPERMKSALEHFDQMLALSRESWTFALAETDDEREWIPNPKQTGVLRIPIAREQIDAWMTFLDEGRALLAGKVLVPFWRGSGDDPRGVNLRRVFTEPTTFDLVLWVQGTAAAPYLEEGRRTDAEVWTRLLRVFGGEFVGFALWIN